MFTIRLFFNNIISVCYGQQTFKPVSYSASIHTRIQGITGRDLIPTIHYSDELQVTHTLTLPDTL